MATRLATAQYHRQMVRSLSSRASTPSAFSDDEDAITPVVETDPVPAPVPAPAAPELGQRSRTDSVTSDKTDASSSRSYVEGTEDVDTAHLWRRMLALQRKFRCYNSARITAALEDESVGAAVPSRACLDLLNDSLSQIPEDIRDQVASFMRDGDPSKRRRKRRVLF